MCWSGVWHLEDSSEGGSHQLVRIECYPPLSFTLPSTVEREMYLFENRQFNSIGKHKAPRLSEMHQTLAFGQGSLRTSEGFLERLCGQRIPLHSYSEGVVPRPDLLPRNLQERGESVRRPIRNQGHTPTSDSRS